LFGWFTVAVNVKLVVPVYVKPTSYGTGSAVNAAGTAEFTPPVPFAGDAPALC
jgi:hypothetical protein